MAVRLSNQKVKFAIGDRKVKRMYLNGEKVYSAGSTVTYWVDIGQQYTEERDEGENCLSPKTFTPAKSGWTFAGWREDAAASGSVLGSKVMGDTPVTLYAVFRQTITLTAYNGSASPSAQSKYRYYNNGNVANPAFTVSPAALSGWSFNGWCTSAAASAGIAYASISNMQLSANLTVYGRYSQTITLSYNGNGATGGSVAAQSGTRYFNSGNYSNPSFALKGNGFSKSGYLFYRWAMGSAAGAQYAPGASVTLSASTVFYAYWVQQAWAFGYTGGIQAWTAPVAGTYRLEAWGASGGACGGAGGRGGYAAGNVQLSKGAVLYVAVGGAGSDAPLRPSSTTTTAGGYNGGGAGISEVSIGDMRYYCNAPGGGATHIGTRNGTLAQYGSAAGLYLAAGGGGGGGYDYDFGTTASFAGGAGGGASGGKGAHDVYGGGGGTQSSGYGFGAGGTRGGGGGYYGGYGTSYYGGGGGGSGYTGGVSGGSMQNGVNAGNGRAAVTLVAIS